MTPRCAPGGCWSPGTRPGCWNRGPGRASASRCGPGRRAGAAAAGAAAACDQAGVEHALDAYPAAVSRVLLPEMAAGRQLLTGFTRHPGAFHLGLASPKGWHAFARFCRRELTSPALFSRREVRVLLALMARF